MSKDQFSSLKSKECICGQTFNRGEDKARHSKKCEAYQKYKNEYMTFDKINDYLNNKRLNKIELYAIYPYNMFCLSDYVKFFKQYPMNNRYYITDNGTRLTIDEIKSLLNKDFLYQKYVIEGLDAVQINELLNNTFSVQTILEWIKRYGIKTRSTSDVTKKCLNKMKKTCLEKYGVENVSVLDSIKQRKINTTVEHYGVEHHLQDENVLKKMKEDLIKKYGVDNVSKIESVQEKKMQTCMENYGVENIFENREYIKECFIQKFGVDNPSKLDWVKIKKFLSYEHLVHNGVAYSKVSIELFDSISNLFPDISRDFKYATHGGEKYLNSKEMFCSMDFSYDNSIGTKIAIEFNGDMWHANPKKYIDSDHPIFDHKELSAKDIWEKDKKRYNFMHENGYQVHIVWESDFKKDPQKIINECCEFIKQNMSK